MKTAFFLVFFLGSNLGSAQKLKPPTPATAPRNTCDSIGLNMFADKLPDYVPVVEDFEKSIATHSLPLFKSVLHPAIKKAATKKEEIFESTVADFGLHKAKLVRNSISLVTFNDDSNVVKCPTGVFTGVIGPKVQLLVTYSFLGSNEQLRITTIFAPVLKSQMEYTKFPHKTGMVMLHGQFWTQGKQTADYYSKEATKWKLLDEPLIAWAMGEAGKRLMSSNPHILYDESLPISRLADELLPKAKAVMDATKKSVNSLNNPWEFIDFVPVFQDGSLELGARYRTKIEESTNDLIAKCVVLGKAIVSANKSIVNRFKGLECLAYQPNEPLENAPAHGSLLQTWKDLGFK